jgi:hypothetical protein
VPCRRPTGHAAVIFFGRACLFRFAPQPANGAIPTLFGTDIGRLPVSKTEWGALPGWNHDDLSGNFPSSPKN